MKINFRTLARLPRGYSIAVLPGQDADGLSAFLAGSEGDAELLLFEPPEHKPRVIARSPGGFISVAPLVIGSKRFAVASTMFKPGFNAAESAILLYPLDEGECPVPSLVAVLPFTHRVAAHRMAGRQFVFASTLCSGKRDKEDWSQPGGIYLAEMPSDPRGPWPMRQIVRGLNKNHGFDFARLGRSQRPGYLVSAMEGLQFLPLADDPSGEWHAEQIDPAEHSDAFAFDWDKDGEPEVFSISPFHGHVLALHRRTPTGWSRTVIHDDLAMGHIVWAGNLLGRPALLAGSRRERRELRLYRAAPDGSVDQGYEVIDEGIGPSQIAVTSPGPERDLLYVAAHGRDEIRLYELLAG